MEMLYSGFAVPSADEPSKFSLVPAVPADAAEPVFKLVVMGPQGGGVDIPDVPIHLWELYQYLCLPIGYPATIVRVK